MNNKKILALLLAFIMILSVGCNNGNVNEADESAENTETEVVQNDTSEESNTEEDITEEENVDNLSTYKYNEWTPFSDEYDLVPDGRDAVGEKGVVSSQKYEASQIGVNILEKGGNAVDAAVATSFALGVCEPNASGLGGGGFMTLRDGETGEVTFIDFREVAPLAATDDMYPLDEEGNVIDNVKARGGLAVAVPGEVAGLLYILDNYGTMSREEVMAPAIELAENGFILTPKATQTFADAYKLMVDYPELGDLYLQDNLPPEKLSLIKNPDLAKTLKIIAEEGADGFYKGEVAEAIVESVDKYGGILTLEDLETYEVEVSEAVQGTYRDNYTIISSPTPSSGGTHLIQIMNILENFDMSQYEPNSAESMHLFSEVFKMVYADRAEYMGDPNYIDVPIQGIISKDYAKHLADKINLEESQEYEADDPWKYEGDTTTHLSVADESGNMVGITKTINYYFGSGVVVDGYGFIMNNEMDDFSPEPGGPNSVAPKKKPLSSMSPTIILKNDEPYMVLGAPGGYTIFAQLAQVLSHVIDNDMDLQDAINEPRIHDSMSNMLTYMDGIDEDEVKKLEEMGHETSHMVNDSFGFVQAVEYLEDGTLRGGADPWSDAKAVGY